MPQYVLNRNFVLRTTAGFSFTFEKGVPMKIPACVEQEVIAVGGECVDGVAKYADDEPVKSMLSQSERNSLIIAAFEEIVKRNDAKEFTASGSPQTRAVFKVTGFSVERAEVDDLWSEFRKAR